MHESRMQLSRHWEYDPPFLFLWSFWIITSQKGKIEIPDKNDFFFFCQLWRICINVMSNWYFSSCNRIPKDSIWFVNIRFLIWAVKSLPQPPRHPRLCSSRAQSMAHHLIYPPVSFALFFSLYLLSSSFFDFTGVIVLYIFNLSLRLQTLFQNLIHVLQSVHSLKPPKWI